NKITVKRKESGAIPNSFYNRIMFNLSNFLGALQYMWGNFYCADLLKNVVHSIDTIQVFAGEKVESDFVEGELGEDQSMRA
ncbi:hypothetical protein, partial [Porphyromonas gulae]|uniref:hypothetical protein n=1 Tax=Porphyromonas gulae TaxID=111105 RepID=UPI00057D35BC